MYIHMYMLVSVKYPTWLSDGVNFCSSQASDDSSSASLQQFEENSDAMTTRNNSSIDLTSSAAMQRIPTIPNIRKPKPTSTGRPEYRGICIPVDIAMMFQVRDNISYSTRVYNHVMYFFAQRWTKAKMFDLYQLSNNESTFVVEVKL